MKHIGEVVVGEESGWQVIKWVEGAPPITVGMKLYAEPVAPTDAIGRLLAEAMDQAVANGANSVSMPDHLVEIAVWLKDQS